MKVEIDKLKPLDTLIVEGESYILVHVATYEYYKDKAEKWDIIDPMIPTITRLLLEAREVTRLLGLTTKKSSELGENSECE